MIKLWIQSLYDMAQYKYRFFFFFMGYRNILICPKKVFEHVYKKRFEFRSRLTTLTEYLSINICAVITIKTICCVIIKLKS